MAASLASILFAVALSLVLGPLLGRVATQWFTGRGLANLMTETRGALLPFLLAPLVTESLPWPSWAVVGLVIGLNQTISVARWITKNTGEWSSSMLGAMALGRSRAALVSANSTARGAVIGTIATTGVQVLLLEALLAGLNYPGLGLSTTIGGQLQQGSGASLLLLLVLGGAGVYLTEMLASWLLQRRTAPSRQKKGK